MTNDASLTPADLRWWQTLTLPRPARGPEDDDEDDEDDPDATPVYEGE